MKNFRQTRFFRCVIFPLALIAVLPACYKWAPMNGPVDRFIIYGRPDQIRLTLLDGGHVEMKSPWIQGDSIVGLDPYYDKYNKTRDTLVVRLSRVRAIDERQQDKVANGALYLGVSAALTAAYVLSDDGGGYLDFSN